MSNKGLEFNSFLFRYGIAVRASAYSSVSFSITTVRIGSVKIKQEYFKIEKDGEIKELPCTSFEVKRKYSIV